MSARAGFAWVILGVCTLSAMAAPEDDELLTAQRLQFRAAYSAAAVGLEANDDALRDYVLYPYVRAARLEYALRHAEGAWGAADLATAEFLADSGDEPIAQVLRRAWLTSLARRESWEVFLERYDGAVATPALECRRLNAQVAAGKTEALVEEIRQRWLTGYRLPTDCEPVFQWLRAEGELPDELVVARVRLLLDAGQASFARVIAARLPKELAAPLLERADFLENPRRMLDDWLADQSRVVPSEVVLEAWSRLARNAPAEALARYEALSERVTGRDQAAEVAIALALGLSWDRRPEALDYFARAPSAAFDDRALEWRARSAMWAARWDLVRESVAAMSQEQQADWAWRYWTARAAEQRDEGASVRDLYAAVRDGDNYYSAMAAARLGERVVPRLEPLPLDAHAVDSIAALDAFRRVRELALTGFRELATREWQYGYSLLPEAQRLQAIHLAARLEIYDVAVSLATSHGQFNDYPLLYPRPYENEVAMAAKLTKVEPHVLYGLLRQESLFRPDASSSAGALGVAQLLPATARETARRWALPAPKREDLLDPTVNITLGAARVAELLTRFGGALPVALSAYNAGEGAAARWLPPRSIDSDVWIENIPYNETRAYVRRVLWHSLVFRWLETGRAQSADDWLAVIDTAAMR